VLDWILNPYGVSLGAYVILWIALLVIIPVSFVVALIQVLRKKR
jgi:hypothetical protein